MEDSLKASFGVQIIDQDVEPSLPFNNSLFQQDNEIRMSDDSDQDESPEESAVAPIVI